MMNGQTGQYDPANDPLAPFLGAFEATEPDVVRRHDDYLGKAAADSHASQQRHYYRHIWMGGSGLAQYSRSPDNGDLL